MSLTKPSILIGFIACAGGFIASTLHAIYHHGLSIFEFLEIALFFLFTFALTYVLVYAPVMRFLRRRIVRRSVRVLLFPFICLTIGMLLIILTWFVVEGLGFIGYGAPLSLRLADFISPETTLLYWMFGTSGLVVGFAFAFRRTGKAEEP